MPINYTPANALSQQQEQLLNGLDNYPLSLIGNDGNEIIVNLNDVRANSVTNIVIENDNTSQYSDDYWTNLQNRLNNYHNEIQDLSNALGNANEDYAIVQTKIDSILDALNRHSLQGSLQNELLLGSFCPDDKSIRLYLSNIAAYAQSHNYNTDDVLVFVYIREMFHAFFHGQVEDTRRSYIREIEEPMAICGMLCYLRNAERALCSHWIWPLSA